jgi:hypothetical protein
MTLDLVADDVETAARTALLGRSREEAALADSRLAGDDHDGRRDAAYSGDLSHQCELRDAADERRIHRERAALPRPRRQTTRSPAPGAPRSTCSR